MGASVLRHDTTSDEVVDEEVDLFPRAADALAAEVPESPVERASRSSILRLPAEPDQLAPMDVVVFLAGESARPSFSMPSDAVVDHHSSISAAPATVTAPVPAAAPMPPFRFADQPASSALFRLVSKAADKPIAFLLRGTVSVSLERKLNSERKELLETVDAAFQTRQHFQRRNTFQPLKEYPVVYYASRVLRRQLKALSSGHYVIAGVHAHEAEGLTAAARGVLEADSAAILVHLCTFGNSSLSSSQAAAGCECSPSSSSSSSSNSSACQGAFQTGSSAKQHRAQS